MTFRIARPIGAIDFAIDGTVLNAQPFSIDYRLPDPREFQSVRGYRIFAPQRGRDAQVQWGEDLCPAAAVAELRAALGTKMEHTIAWTDPDGTAVSIDTIAGEVETEVAWDAPGFYEPVRVRFVERAPARDHTDEGMCDVVELDGDFSTLGSSTNVGGPAWSRDSAFVVSMDAGSAPNIAVWPWDGVSLGTPDVQSISVGASQMAIHPTQDIIAITVGGTTEVIEVYEFVAGVIGSLIATSAGMIVGIGGTTTGLAWSPDGTYIAAVGTGSADLSVFSWNGAAFGSLISATITGSAGAGTFNAYPAFAADNSFVFVADAGTGHLVAFPFNGSSLGTGVRPGTTPTGSNGQSASIHPSGDFVAIGNSAGGNVYCYPWDGAAFGAEIAGDVGFVGATASRNCIWSQGGTYLWVLDAGSRIYAYRFDAAAQTLTQECILSMSTTTKTALPSPDNESIAVSFTDGDLRLLSTGLATV